MAADPPDPGAGPRDVEVVVVGAGQAGLASAYHLGRHGLRPGRELVVLDHAAGPGGAWLDRWPSLRMSSVHGVHDLPGMKQPPVDEDAPAAVAVPAYFCDYERRFDLRVHRPVSVTAVREAGDGRLLVETARHGTWRTRVLLNATGTWERPFWPVYPGASVFQGRQLHSAGYTRAEDFAGQRVVVVGGGITAVQLLGELAAVARTTWVTRRPPVFREDGFDEPARRRAVAVVEERVRAGLPPGSVVSITGLAWTPDVRAAAARGVLERLPMFDRLVPAGVAWADGRRVQADVVLWATGFRPALAHLAPLHLRERGGGIRLDGPQVVRDPRVLLVGYGPAASTVGATRAARAAARVVTADAQQLPYVSSERPAQVLPNVSSSEPIEAAK